MIRLGPLSLPQAEQIRAELAKRGQNAVIDAEGEQWALLLTPEAEQVLAGWLAEQQQHHWQHGEPLAAGQHGESLLSGWRLPPSGPVTLSVLVVAALVYLAMQLAPQTLFDGLRFFASSDDMLSWQQWRWFTPILLHFSIVHVVFNLLWWWQLAAVVERVESSRALLLITALTAALPNALQWLWSGPGFGGLSGVVYGLLGYVWLSGRLRPQLGIRVPPAIMGLMVVWLAWGFVAFVGPEMANGAHLGGLVVGLALAGWRHR